MDRLEQTVEGVPAAGLAVGFVKQHAPGLEDELSLLAAVSRTISGAVTDVKAEVAAAVLPKRP